jgi:predicted ATPase
MNNLNEPADTYEISETTKREIFDILTINQVEIYGKLTEVEFLKRIYILSELPSTDGRYKNAEGDIIQHTVNNDDWPSNWIINDNRFGLIYGSDQVFIKFICELLHPAVREDENEIKTLFQLFNESLYAENWELYEIKKISNKPVFSGRKKASIDNEIKIKFKRIPRYKGTPTGEPYTCLLMEDNWNDFGFYTAFILFFINKDKTTIQIGPVRIMQSEQVSTNIPQEFTSLGDGYCSIGFKQNYYEEIRQLPQSIRDKILFALRDCVYDNAIYEKFKDQEVMKKSLLRDITVRNITESFKNILNGNARLTPYDFTFSLEGQEHAKINISVIPESSPPTNIHVLIGRNGVGKTRILSGIADVITKNTDNINSIGFNIGVNFQEENDESGRFANLVTVVFSIFDSFEPILKEKIIGDIRYSYVGLKKKNNKITDFKKIEELDNEFKTSLKECLSGNRKNRWIESIKILNSDPCLAELELDQLAIEADNIKNIYSEYKILSSGHKIVLLTITKLVQLVDDRTLVLIDEPENHLHPPLLSSFVRALSNLLVQRNGVALIATHSPVILQEVPKSCVSIIRRSGEELSIDRPSIETFGENVGTLTREVFELEVRESGFHKILSDFVGKKSYIDIINEFNNQVGAEGRAILRALILDAQNEEN